MFIKPLPDVTSDKHAETAATLQWVGMEDIAVPVAIPSKGNKPYSTSAKAGVYVNLADPKAKGIHMSRLHLMLNNLAELECNKANIDQLLDNMVASQGAISQQAKIKLAFDLMLNKPALLSDESGFQSYPIIIHAEKNNQGYSYELEVTVAYSSTCPCSASLAQQLYAKAVHKSFPGDTIDKAELMDWIQSQAGAVATPHSQRSYAYIRLAIGANNWPDLGALIVQLEAMIGTPVQTAVKRIDEQAFAKLNAENLMFCEDAARRIKFGLEALDYVQDYWFKVEHQESLHAHNAVVIDQKFTT